MQPDTHPQPALEVLWPDERIAEWLDDHWLGVGSAEAIGAEMRAEYEAIRNAQYQERQRLAAQVVSLTERVQALIRLNNENAEIGARHMHLGNATMNIAVATVADMKAKDERIARLERELATAQEGNGKMPTEQPELKSCPWCATIPEIYDADKLIVDEDGDWAGIRCETCFAFGPPIETDGRESADCVDDAVAAWNKRTTAQQATAVGGRE